MIWYPRSVNPPFLSGFKGMMTGCPGLRDSVSLYSAMNQSQEGSFIYSAEREENVSPSFATTATKSGKVRTLSSWPKGRDAHPPRSQVRRIIQQSRMGLEFSLISYCGSDLP